MSNQQERTEVGYLCSHGHFIFYDDPDLDNVCGSKRIGGVYVGHETGNTQRLERAMREAREDFGAAIGRAYGEAAMGSATSKERRV